jgi:molecular chaperone GrpE
MKQENKVEQDEQTTVTVENVDYKDKYIRLLADVDNIRKNTAKQISNAYLMANEELIKEILPYLDSLDLAINHSRDGQNNGYEVLRKQLLDILANFGVKEIEIKAVEQFDETKMNAIMSMPAQHENLHNKVKDVVKKGYMLNGNIIRYADVIVYNAA